VRYHHARHHGHSYLQRVCWKYIVLLLIFTVSWMFCPNPTSPFILLFCLFIMFSVSLFQLLLLLLLSMEGNNVPSFTFQCHIRVITSH
jgi:hypothetical protein